MALQTIPYTYTERKRIRKSFGKRESVLEVPYLLTMQKDSYVAYLQKDVPPVKRKPEGLQAAFLSAFPIVSHNGYVEMRFIEYNIASVTFAFIFVRRWMFDRTTRLCRMSPTMATVSPSIRSFSCRTVRRSSSAWVGCS